jgi:hypothetical protein
MGAMGLLKYDVVSVLYVTKYRISIYKHFDMAPTRLRRLQAFISLKVQTRRTKFRHFSS